MCVFLSFHLVLKRWRWKKWKKQEETTPEETTTTTSTTTPRPGTSFVNGALWIFPGHHLGKIGIAKPGVIGIASPRG